MPVQIGTMACNQEAAGRHLISHLMKNIGHAQERNIGYRIGPHLHPVPGVLTSEEKRVNILAERLRDITFG
jgi:hypothetical protein